MDEWRLVWLVPMRLFAVLVFSTLYVIGGRQGKWVRRWLAPILFLGVCILITYFVETSYWKLAPLCAMPIVLSFGYSNNDGKGWIRRLIYGLSFGAIGLGMSFMCGCWPLGMIHMIVAVMASMVLGLMNPIPAVNEEATISILSTVCIPFMIQ